MVLQAFVGGQDNDGLFVCGTFMKNTFLDAALDDGDQRSVEFAVTVEEGLKSRRVFVCDGFKLSKIKGKLAFVHNIESDKGIKLRCAI